MLGSLLGAAAGGLFVLAGAPWPAALFGAASGFVVEVMIRSTSRPGGPGGSGGGAGGGSTSSSCGMPWFFGASCGSGSSGDDGGSSGASSGGGDGGGGCGGGGCGGGGCGGGGGD